MRKKVFIGVGHGGSDPGAVKYVKEADVNLTIAMELGRLLGAAGVTVGFSRVKDENDSLTEEIREANDFAPDLAIDVHNNAGGGDGFEALVQTGVHAAESRHAAECIEKYVKAMGQNSRGIKTRQNSSGADWYGFNREVKCPAVIVEGFFVDNAKDAADFDTVAEQKKLAAAYAAGILEHLGVDSKREETGNLYRVQVGAFREKANAEALLEQIKAAGFDAFIVEARAQGTTSAKTNEELAAEVLAGLWGNGTERKDKLTAAGYDYAAVQKIVDEMV